MSSGHSDPDLSTRLAAALLRSEGHARIDVAIKRSPGGGCHALRVGLIGTVAGDADAATLVERLGPADGLERRLLLDLWTHDQDVRSTVGRPGQRDGPTAEWVREWLTDFVQAKFTGA